MGQVAWDAGACNLIAQAAVAAGFALAREVPEVPAAEVQAAGAQARRRITLLVGKLYLLLGSFVGWLQRPFASPGPPPPCRVLLFPTITRSRAKCCACLFVEADPIPKQATGNHVTLAGWHVVFGAGKCVC